MKMKQPWFCRGDIDGFFGLFVDNLTQLMLITVLCRYACGFPAELIAGKILPAAGLSILIGNIFYTLEARRLARKSADGDMTALPFGVNTISLLAFIFLVMSPVYNETGDADLAWRVGLAACFMSGVVETLGAFVGSWVKRHTPRAALLAGLGGVALSFIALGFSFQVFAAPAVAFVPMMLVLCFYAARVRLPFQIPGGLAAMLCGGLIAWTLKGFGFISFSLAKDPIVLAVNLPTPALKPLFSTLFDPNTWRYASIVLPVALFNVIGSIQNLESAEAAGDKFEPKPALLVNGATSLLASLFGSPFPTSIYIGHPGWKSMGARTGYSTLNGIAVAALCFFGGINALLKIMPIEATLGILIWIGLVIVSEAYAKTDMRHGVAVAIGFIPPLGAWMLNIIETVLRVAGTNLYDAIDQFHGELYVGGILSLYQGFLLIAIILSAILAHVVDRKFVRAAVWSFIGAGLSCIGLIHAYELTPSGLHGSLQWMAAPWFVFAYATLGVLLLVMGKISKPLRAIPIESL